MTNHGKCVPVGLGVCSFCAANVDRAIAARDATTNTAVRILVPTGTVCRNGRNEIAGMSDGMGRHGNGRLLGDLRDFRITACNEVGGLVDPENIESGPPYVDDDGTRL